MSHSTSITTGQGSEALGNWMARGLGANWPGNSRGPPPACTIAIHKGAQVSTPATQEQNSAPLVAENLMMDPRDLLLGPAESQQTGAQSASHESIQDNMLLAGGSRGLLSEEGDYGSQQELSEVSEDEDDLKGSKCLKPEYTRSRKGKEKKKVGRPIAYRGDPNAPELTDLERRRIKRRIANRESARRVRHKRQEELEDMQIKMEQIQAHNTHLQQHAANIKEQKDIIVDQLRELQQNYENVCIDNKQLTIEIQALRQSLQLKMSALEEELDKRATEAEGSMTHFGFRNPAIQQRPLSPLHQGQPAPMNHISMDGKPCAFASLDWLPSLSLDEFTHMDIVNDFFEDAPASGFCIKGEAGSKQ